MNNLPIEIKTIILDLLELESQINFIFVSKENSNLIKYWKINKQICINNKMLQLSYYDCFENIIIYGLLNVYPKKLQYLTFGEEFNEPIKNCILPSVTHLTFGPCFNQSIKKCIPSEARSVWLNLVFLQKTRFAKNLLL